MNAFAQHIEAKDAVGTLQAHDMLAAKLQQPLSLRDAIVVAQKERSPLQKIVDALFTLLFGQRGAAAFVAAADRLNTALAASTCGQVRQECRDEVDAELFRIVVGAITNRHQNDIYDNLDTVGAQTLREALAMRRQVKAEVAAQQRYFA